MFFNNVAYLSEVRRGNEFEGMIVKSWSHKEILGDREIDVIRFENPNSKIARDLIVHYGNLYYTDLYNGLIPYDINNAEYVFPWR